MKGNHQIEITPFLHPAANDRVHISRAKAQGRKERRKAFFINSLRAWRLCVTQLVISYRYRAKNRFFSANDRSLEASPLKPLPERG
jgi:hypothetical protein